MNRRSTELNKAQAQLLMSQLLDGELSPRDAARLQAYLERRPEEADWMEGIDLARQARADLPAAPDAQAAAAAIAAAIERETTTPFAQAAARKPRFALFGSFAAAAAVALVGGLVWLASGPGDGFEGDGLYASKGSVVEFVSTDIPGASTFVYTDDESGWTVVWVEAIASSPNTRG